jgi:hypothetical protein
MNPGKSFNGSDAESASINFGAQFVMQIALHNSAFAICLADCTARCNA